MKKLFKIILICFGLLIFLFVGYFFIGRPPESKNIVWGVNFSQKHSEGLGLDWKEVYVAQIRDLGVKNIKLITHWDLIEPEKGKFNFDDLDWQIERAKEGGVKILLVVGMKTGRWPECHIPGWVGNLQKEEQI